MHAPTLKKLFKNGIKCNGIIISGWRGKDLWLSNAHWAIHVPEASMPLEYQYMIPPGPGIGVIHNSHSDPIKESPSRDFGSIMPANTKTILSPTGFFVNLKQTGECSILTGAKLPVLVQKSYLDLLLKLIPGVELKHGDPHEAIVAYHDDSPEFMIMPIFSDDLELPGCILNLACQRLGVHHE